MTLLIDGAVTGHLERVFAELKIRTGSRPVYRSVVGIHIEKREEDDLAAGHSSSRRSRFSVP